MSERARPSPILPRRPELYREGDLEKFAGCLARYLDEEHPLEMNVSRVERIHILMRRHGIRCPHLARRLRMRGLEVEPDTLYRMLNREVKAGGRGREPHVEAILTETERILGLEVDSEHS